MSKKDYELVAGELQWSLPDIEVDDYKFRGFALAVEAVARAFSKDNPRFDSKRFYRVVYGERGEDA